MKLTRKLVAITLTSMMVLTMFSSCGTPSSAPASPTDNTSGTTGGSTAEAEPIQFSYCMASKYVDWLNELKWYDVLKERTGAEIELISVGDTDSEYQGMIDQRIISNTLTDAVLLTPAQANVYGAEGAFVDLAPIIAEYGPNIQKYIDSHEDFKKLVTNEQGQIFALYNENVAIANLMFCREDMLQKAGANMEPKTLAEYEETLKTLRDYYKDVPNFYPLTGRGTFWKYWLDEFNARGDIIDGKSVGIYNAGRGYDLKSDGFKKMIEWFIHLKSEKLIDPEWLTGAGTEESWEQKMFTGLGAVGYDFYTRPSWFEVNGGEKTDPNYKMAVMPYLQSANGTPTYKLADTQYATGWPAGIAVSMASEKKAVGIIKFLDYIWSPEGMELIQWGIEGESFKKENGKNVYLLTYEDQEATPVGQKRWSFLSDRTTFPRPVDMNGFYSWNTELIANAATKYFNTETLHPSIQLPLTVEEQQEMANLYSAIDPMVQQGCVAFVNGQRPMSDWDNFLKEIDALGYERMIELQQIACDRM